MPIISWVSSTRPRLRALSCGVVTTKVLAAGQRRRAVLGRDAVDLLATLGVDAEHRRRQAVGADDEVADLQRPDRAEAVRGEHLASSGCARPLMYASGATSMVPGREQLGDRLGVEHVVQRVVERPQVGVDLLAERAGQEAEPLARLDRRAGSG